MDYSIEKTLPFEVNTSSDAKKLLLFIEAIFASLPTIDKQKIQYDFLFENGEIRCSTTAREEFLQEIFGTTDFQLVDMSVFFIDSKSSTDLYIKYFCGFGISSSDKDLLIKASEAYDLEISRLQQRNTKEKVVIEHHEHNITNIDQANQININGDIQNSAIGNGNTVSLTTNNINEFKSGSFWKGIWQKIVANALWWGIGFIVVVTGIATYFKQYVGK